MQSEKRKCRLCPAEFIRGKKETLLCDVHIKEYRRKVREDQKKRGPVKTKCRECHETFTRPNKTHGARCPTCLKEKKKGGQRNIQLEPKKKDQ